MSKTEKVKKEKNVRPLLNLFLMLFFLLLLSSCKITEHTRCAIGRVKTCCSPATTRKLLKKLPSVSQTVQNILHPHPACLTLTLPIKNYDTFLKQLFHLENLLKKLNCGIAYEKIVIYEITQTPLSRTVRKPGTLWLFPFKKPQEKIYKITPAHPNSIRSFAHLLTFHSLNCPKNILSTLIKILQKKEVKRDR